MATRYIYAASIAIVLVFTLGLRIWDPAPVAQLRLLSFDAYQRFEPRVYDPKAPVRIIDVDEESLRKIGQWPWPRTQLADLVDRLRDLGAAAIGFDIVFTERDRLSPETITKRFPSSAQFQDLRNEIDKLPAYDGVFSTSLESAPVVLGFVGTNGTTPNPVTPKAGMSFAGDDPKLFVPEFSGAAASLEILQRTARGVGALNWLPEYDQIIRRVPLILNINDQLFPTLSLETLRLAQGASSYLIKSSGASGEEAFGQQTGINTVRVGDFFVPTDANGQMWLRFSPSEKRRFIPAWKVFEDQVSPEDVQGRIILIGTSAAGLFDLRTTPLEPSVPGVEIHAQAVEQMFAQDFLIRPDFALGAELFYILIAGLLLGVLIFKLGALKGVVVGVLAIFGGLALCWFAFDQFRWLVDPVYPTLSLALVQLVGTVFMYLTTEAERNRVRSAFGFYMAPALVEELAQNPDKLKLGGEIRDISVLFCDVRGFTTISEGLNAEELTSFINNLFTPLSEIIVNNRGTIDKYMGDAIMAFWNAPLDDEAHGANACRAALQMMSAVEKLNIKWRAEAAALGVPYHPVQIGIGINSGPCCVGNLGSEMRFDYSAIGDNVNVGSRLEGQTKAYNVSVVAAEATRKLAPDYAWLKVGDIHVKGRHEPVCAFALLGDDRFARSKQFRSLSQCHSELLDALEAEDNEKARVLLKTCRKQGADFCEELYHVYEDRLQ